MAELESQIKTLKASHEEELESLNKQISELKDEMETLKKKKVASTGVNVLDQSLDDIEGKIGEFNVQLKELKNQT